MYRVLMFVARCCALMMARFWWHVVMVGLRTVSYFSIFLFSCFFPFDWSMRRESGARKGWDFIRGFDTVDIFSWEDQIDHRPSPIWKSVRSSCACRAALLLAVLLCCRVIFLIPNRQKKKIGLLHAVCFFFFSACIYIYFSACIYFFFSACIYIFLNHIPRGLLCIVVQVASTLHFHLLRVSVHGPFVVYRNRSGLSQILR